MFARLAAAFVVLSIFAASAHAGVPALRGDSECSFPCGLPPIYGCRTIVAVSPPLTGCQYRFNQMGNLDTLTLNVTVRDAFQAPLPGTEVMIELVPDDGSTVLCGCAGLVQTELADAAGAVRFDFARLGGHGQIRVDVSLRPQPADPWFLFCNSIRPLFTSPDLNASCDPGNVPVATVVDLGLWAAGLPPGYEPTSDYNCDGTVNVIDLGLWATGTAPGTCAP